MHQLEKRDAIIEELVKACKLALIHLEQCDDHEEESAEAGADAIAACRAAVTKAEEE